MVAEPIYERVPGQHRWVLHETYSVTSQQAKDRSLGLNTALPVGARIHQLIVCHDCGRGYISPATILAPCPITIG